jgi:hypothetical protein
MISEEVGVKKLHKEFAFKNQKQIFEILFLLRIIFTVLMCMPPTVFEAITYFQC